MQNYLHTARAWWDRQWQRFILLAQGPHALFWLAFCAITDPIFFPIAPEIYLAALILAHPARWKTYVATAIPFSVIGAAIGYVVGAFLFNTIGMPLLQVYHLEGAFVHAQSIFHGKVFVVMILVAFSLIPEKAVVLAAGFLGVPFMPFWLGFLVGRAIRITLIAYLVRRFGSQALALVKRYFIFFTLVVLALIAYFIYYGATYL